MTPLDRRGGHSSQEQRDWESSRDIEAFRELGSNKISLKNLLLDEASEWFVSIGEKPYRARQIFRWLYTKGVRCFDQMTDMSKDLRERLAELATIDPLSLHQVLVSDDQTRKLVFDLADGARVESVIIPNPGRNTLCISSQVGCAMGCRFCRTAQLGFARNLSAAEIVDQVIHATQHFASEGRLTNIVLMGMGEPLNNFRQVIRAMRLMMDDHALNISSRRITLSTCGLVPQIKQLGEEITVNLAVSLNATTDEIRDQIMPVNRRYPLASLMDALRKFPLPQRRRITFEYVLLRGINDSPRDARRLIKLLHGIPSKVNLIPFNPFPGADFERPSDEDVFAFQEILNRTHINTLVRETRGLDIAAACGQLGRTAAACKRP